MKLSELEVRNFKNISNIHLYLNSEKNLFLKGENSQGKTAVLDAIALALSGIPQEIPLELLIKKGTDSSFIKCNLTLRNTTVEIKTVITKKTVKRFLNFKETSLTEFRHNGIQTWYFRPDSGDLIRGPAQIRREFFFNVLKTIGDTRYKLVSELLSVIKQRNSLLRRMQKDFKRRFLYSDELDQWDELLFNKTLAVSEVLSSFLQAITIHMNKYWLLLDKHDRELSVMLSWPGKNNLLDELKRLREIDINKGYTTVGLHRFDVVINIDSLPVRTAVSHGDQKALALALFFATATFNEINYDREPLYLLDDVFSELDNQRRETIMEIAPQGRSIMTGTENYCDSRYSCYKVVSGSVLSG